VSREQIPEDVAASERAAYRAKARADGKDGADAEAAADRQMEKFYEASCLLDQAFIRDESRSIGELIKEVIARTGENIQVRRFARFRLGEG
jgi:elongation factor Ts